MNPTKESRRKTWRLIVKIGIAFLVLVIIAGLIANIYLNRFIANSLKSRVSAATNGLYTLNFRKVETNVFARKIAVLDAEIFVDSSHIKEMLTARVGPRFFLEGKFPTVELDKIHWMHLIFSKDLVAGALVLHSPNIILSQVNTQEDSAKNESPVQDLDGIKINSIHVDDGNVEYRYMKRNTETPTIYRLNKVRMDMEGVTLGNEKGASRKKAPFKKIELAIANYEFRTSDSLYFVGFHDLEYSSEKDEGKAAQLYIRPRLSADAYSNKLPYQKERNDVLFENVTLGNLEIDPLIERGEVNIKNVSIGSGHWNIYLSRVPPLPPARHNVVPSQPLLKIPQGISIDTLHVNKFQLDYREYNTATQETGQVKFNDVTGSAVNITNEKAAIEKNPHLVVDLKARLMGAGKFDARFDFLLSDSSGQFSVDARLGKMEGELLNPGFIPLNKVAIKKGTIDEMRCYGKGNQEGITGDVALLYHDLHIAVMERDKEADTMKRKTMVSLVANILVKNDNPKKDEPVRVARNISLRRDPRKSYFNMLWMALFTGIIKIASGK